MLNNYYEKVLRKSHKRIEHFLHFSNKEIIIKEWRNATKKKKVDDITAIATRNPYTFYIPLYE